MRITVYCGAQAGNSKEYITIAKNVGEWIVKNNHSLVFGGCNVGLMNVIADVVLNGKQEVIGVLPQFLVDKGIAKEEVTTLEIVTDLINRKKRMMGLADAFIALPGGPGTLEEIIEVISWRRLNQHDKPCLIINTNGYYNCLKEQYKTMVQEGFLTHKDYKSIIFIDDLDQLNAYLS